MATVITNRDCNRRFIDLDLLVMKKMMLYKTQVDLSLHMNKQLINEDRDIVDFIDPFEGASLPLSSRPCRKPCKPGQPSALKSPILSIAQSPPYQIH